MDREELERQLEELQEILQKINEAIKNSVSFPHSLSVAGRSITYRSLNELLSARENILREITNLKRALDLLDNGKLPIGNINFRF